ncbi:hypothetical protein DsansV1_C25g0188621 [Dioscorea sansibarensis]
MKEYSLCFQLLARGARNHENTWETPKRAHKLELLSIETALHQVQHRREIYNQISGDHPPKIRTRRRSTRRRSLHSEFNSRSTNSHCHSVNSLSYK